MSTSLTITESQNSWTPIQTAALIQLGLGNATTADLEFFLHQAKRTGLDPFARQIYMINRGGKYGIQTSIDGFRIIAQRSGNYGGQTGAEWCGEDGVWKDVWLAKTPPSAARIGVYYKDSPHATYAVAKWASYAVETNPIWRKMPDVMLAKCAESLALRKAFPNDMSGIYTDEEMAQADIVEAKVIPQKVEIKAITQPVTPESSTINWEALLLAIDSIKDKEALRGLWKARLEILDVTVPDTQKTLREVLLEKKVVFDAQSN